MFYDRNPESMRTVPRVCAAGRDSVPRYPARAFFFAYFSKNRPRTEKSLETLIPGYLGDTFWAPENFPVFSIFQPPQHRPHVELREPGSELRNPGFPFFTGGRDSEGTGVWSLGSEVAGFGFPTPRSIYTYSRSTAPAAVMLFFEGVRFTVLRRDVTMIIGIPICMIILHVFFSIGLVYGVIGKSRSFNDRETNNGNLN